MRLSSLFTFIAALGADEDKISLKPYVNHALTLIVLLACGAPRRNPGTPEIARIRCQMSSAGSSRYAAQCKTIARQNAWDQWAEFIRNDDGWRILGMQTGYSPGEYNPRFRLRHVSGNLGRFIIRTSTAHRLEGFADRMRWFDLQDARQHIVVSNLHVADST